MTHRYDKDQILNRLKLNEEYKYRAIKFIMEWHNNNKPSYFGTLVEDVRELPQYKDPSLMKEIDLEGILPS